MDNDEEGARLTWREENRELIAKHRVQMGTIPDAERKKVMEVHRLFESIVERATVEPRGCPTPGSCSAVAELADLKQRLLPQFQGRAQRAEHERDGMLEQLIAARSATGSTDLDEFVRVARTFSDEHYQNALVAELRRVYHALAIRDAAPVEERAQDRPDWAQQLPGAEIFDRAARYEYLRTLNPRKFAALYNEALMGVHQFDDLVDRYRDAGEKP